MALERCACGRTLPPPTRLGGRPRTKCEVCSPPRPRRAEPAGDGRPKPAAPVLLPLTGPAFEPGPAGGTLVPESVYSATLSQLAAVGREHTAAGAAALALARQLDAGVASAPAVSNALLKALEVALAGAKPAADALDQLANRRHRKAAGA